MRSLIPWRRSQLSTWHLFPELDEWHRSVDELFERFFGEAALEKGEKLELPAVESFRRNGDYVVRMDVPGMEPKDVDISVTGNVLTVKGERKAESEAKENDYVRREISYGSFERRVGLPEGADPEKIQAKYEKGVLEISLPAPRAAETTKIAIKADTPKAEAAAK